MTPVSFPAGAADPFQIGRDDPTTPDNDALAPDRAQPLADPPPPSPRSAALPDATIGLARAAAVEEAGSDTSVGEYLGAVAEDDVAVSAAFGSLDRGYRGWYWSVTLALVDPSAPTVSEVLLLPGHDALLAPAWVPWERRVRAGDLGPGDLLPPPADDIRLLPGYVFSDDPAVKEVAYEFGLGRERVLSREGRDDAAERWHEGTFGPEDPIALAAPASCGTCAFYVPLAGLLGSTFGACANEYSPADGRVADAAYGCGAHSQAVIDAPMISANTDTVVDEFILDVHPRPLAAEPESHGQAVLDPEPDGAAVLDPEPDAEPDLLADVVTDPVADEVIAAAETDRILEADADPDLAGDIAEQLATDEVISAETDPDLPADRAADPGTDEVIAVDVTDADRGPEADPGVELDVAWDLGRQGQGDGAGRDDDQRVAGDVDGDGDAPQPPSAPTS